MLRRTSVIRTKICSKPRLLPDTKQALRDHPIKFYRQRSIDNYIVDFYCSSAKLVIELDGSQHNTEEGMEYDAVRMSVLEEYGLEVRRFSNLEIERNFKIVCDTIDQKLKERIYGQTNS